MKQWDIASLKRPIQTLTERGFCGDATLIIENPSTLFIALFDGAGHGYKAAKVAEKAMQFLENASGQELCTLMVSLHQVLKATPGGVVGVCRIDKKSGQLRCTGIGNVVIRLFNPESYHVIVRGGVLGHEIVEPKEYTTRLNPGNILMLYSDGIIDHFQPADFPRFGELSAMEIARITLDYFSKTLDDAAVIVLKVNSD